MIRMSCAFVPETAMRRREFISLAGGVAAAWSLAARAQQAERIRRIGILETISAKLNAANFDAFRAGMNALGYSEGNNIVIEYRSAEGDGSRFPQLVADLLRSKVDVIVTRGTPATLAAKAATTSVPIVMAAVGDPLILVASLSHPGSNITGLSGYGADLEAKRVDVLKELIPGAKRIAGLYHMGNPAVPLQRKQLQKATQRLGVQSELLDVRQAADIGAAFENAKRHAVDAIQVGVDALTQDNRKLIAELAVEQRLPTIYASKDYVEAGGLIAYGPNFADLYRRAATYVDTIFKGADPADLPIEQPTKFELLINLRAAKAIQLTISPILLVRADEVIE